MENTIKKLWVNLFSHDWVFIMCDLFQGHRRPGEVQQHHISILQRSQGNCACVWYHKTGDLWGPSQVDENDWQGKLKSSVSGSVYYVFVSFYYNSSLFSYKMKHEFSLSIYSMIFILQFCLFLYRGPIPTGTDQKLGLGVAPQFKWFVLNNTISIWKSMCGNMSFYCEFSCLWYDMMKI